MHRLHWQTISTGELPTQVKLKRKRGQLKFTKTKKISNSHTKLKILRRCNTDKPIFRLRRVDLREANALRIEV